MSIDPNAGNQSGDGSQIPSRADSAAQLNRAMERLLKAHRPLKALYEKKAQADALVKSSGQTKNEACTIPGAPFKDLDAAAAFVARAAASYADYSRAVDARQASDAAVFEGETDFDEARKALRSLIAELEAAETTAKADAEAAEEAASKAQASGLDLAPAQYLASLAWRLHRQIEERPTTTVALDNEEQEERIKAINAALAEYLLVTGNLIALHQEITARVEEIGEIGNHVRSRIEPPIRPTEEEVQRFLSEMEGHLTRRQKVHRSTKEAVLRRPELLASHEKLSAQLNAVEESADDTALPLWYRRFVAHMVKEQKGRPLFYSALSSHIYEIDYIKDGCTSLDSAEVPATTQAEDEALIKLRKQMRVVAYALGHKSEARHGLNAVSDPDRYISTSDVYNCTNWQELSVWFREFAQDRDSREQDKLVYAKKHDLLNRAIAHHEEEEKREAASLHAMFSNLLPKLRRLPADEMRVVINACALLARPAGKDENKYPIY